MGSPNVYLSDESRQPPTRRLSSSFFLLSAKNALLTPILAQTLNWNFGVDVNYSAPPLGWLDWSLKLLLVQLGIQGAILIWSNNNWLAANCTSPNKPSSPDELWAVSQGGWWLRYQGNLSTKFDHQHHKLLRSCQKISSWWSPCSKYFSVVYSVYIPYELWDCGSVDVLSIY